MNNEKDIVAVLYYQDKIIDTIKNCKDLNALQYLEKFNRIWIEKSAEEKE